MQESGEPLLEKQERLSCVVWRSKEQELLNEIHLQ